MTRARRLLLWAMYGEMAYAWVLWVVLGMAVTINGWWDTVVLTACLAVSVARFTRVSEERELARAQLLRDAELRGRTRYTDRILPAPRQ